MAVKFVTEAEFDEVIKEGIWIADFYTEHCPPCKILEVELDAILADNPSVNLAKCDIEKDPALQMRFEIFGTPTLHFYNDGVLTGKHVGGGNVRAKVEEMLAQCMYGE